MGRGEGLCTERDMAAPPPPVLARRALILGDGNFTFSVSFVQQCEKHSLDIDQLWCTSFDSYDSLILKYPESSQRLLDLSRERRAKWVTVAHGVNATLLGNSLPLDCSPFSDIIFNFPHLGFEDIVQHQWLLAHVMSSGKEKLQSRGGTIAIALAESQGSNWRIVEIANRLGLECRRKLPMLSSEWPGYEMKRHQTGKSFQSRVMQCYHYILCYPEDVDRQDSLLEVLHMRRETEHSLKPDNGAVVSQPAVSSDTSFLSAPCVSPSAQVELTTQGRKKRKVHALVEGLYRAEEATTVIDEKHSTGTQFLCLVCAKHFPTEQGARTHAYSIHVLPTLSTPSGSTSKSSTECDGHSAAAESGVELVCNDCQRTFSNADALMQHRVAKHTGKHTDTQAFRGESSVTQFPVEEDSLQCTVCLQRFPTEEQFQRHSELGFIPRDVCLAFDCDRCGKKFSQERAFKQHSNFCSRVNRTLS